jgi:CYTH domain-containing protein
MEFSVPLTRRFLIAPSLTRLVRKELGWEKVVEGHFAPHAERQSYVRAQQEVAHLVLTSLNVDPESDEEMTELPMAHAKALLQVCPGVLNLERSPVSIPRYTAVVDRFVSPDPLDLVSVEFASRVEAADFLPPVWFGAEVTENEAYLYRAIALLGLPSMRDTEVSNAGLEAVLDIVGAAVGLVRPSMPDPQVQAPSEDDELFSTMVVIDPARSLPRAEALELSKRSRVDVERRRPKLETVKDQPESEDKRLAGIIMEFSTSLMAAPPVERADANVRPRLGEHRSNR